MFEGFEIHFKDYVLHVRGALERVVRFFDPSETTYPPDIFEGADTVFQHTLNCLGLALAQVSPPDDSHFSLEHLLHILQEHDVAELYEGDTPVLLPASVRHADGNTTAHKDLSPEQLEFEQARVFIYEQNYTEIPSPEGVVANVVDLVEGNMTFFEILSHYVQVRHNGVVTPDIERLVVMGEVYFVQIQALFLLALQQLPESPSYVYAKNSALDFLNQQEEAIQFIKIEIMNKSPILRDIRRSTVFVLGSISAHMAAGIIHPEVEGQSIETLLNLYVDGVRAGKISPDLIRRMMLDIQTAITGATHPELTIGALQFGLLEAQRNILNKPISLSELSDPKRRRELAKKMFDMFSGAD